MIWCGSHYKLVSFLSSELVSTSFKERIDVFNAHYREESSLFPAFWLPFPESSKGHFFHQFWYLYPFGLGKREKVLFFDHFLRILGATFHVPGLRTLANWWNWGAMATREEILEEIRQLNVSIEGLQSDLLSSTIDANERVAIRNERVAIRNQIIAKQETLTALITSQQGNFSSRRSTALFPILSM